MKRRFTWQAACAGVVAVGWLTCPGSVFGQKPDQADIVQSSSWKLASEVRGIVKEVLVKEGQHVKKGEVLLRLDAREAQLKLKIAELQIPRAEAEMKAAEAAAGEAKAQYERLRPAFRPPPGSVVQEELSMKKFVWEKHRFDAQTRAADLDISKLQSDLARLTLEKHEIRSPSAGVIQLVNRRRGEAVQELDVVIQLRVDGGNK